MYIVYKRIYIYLNVKLIVSYCRLMIYLQIYRLLTLHTYTNKKIHKHIYIYIYIYIYMYIVYKRVHI